MWQSLLFFFFFYNFGSQGDQQSSSEENETSPKLPKHTQKKNPTHTHTKAAGWPGTSPAVSLTFPLSCLFTEKQKPQSEEHSKLVGASVVLTNIPTWASDLYKRANQQPSALPASLHSDSLRWQDTCFFFGTLQVGNNIQRFSFHQQRLELKTKL